MKSKRAQRLVKIVLTGLFTALVFVATVSIRLPIPGNGYVNFGDAIIFVCALLLGGVPAMIAGAFGSMFADLIGFPVYAGFTFLIKGLEGLIAGAVAYKAFHKAPRKSVSLVFALGATILAGVEMLIGYFFTDWILYGLPAALLTFAPSALQGGVSIAIALPLAFALKGTAAFTLGKYKQKRAQPAESESGADKEKEKERDESGKKKEE